MLLQGTQPASIEFFDKKLRATDEQGLPAFAIPLGHNVREASKQFNCRRVKDWTELQQILSERCTLQLLNLLSTNCLFQNLLSNEAVPPLSSPTGFMQHLRSLGGEGTDADLSAVVMRGAFASLSGCIAGEAKALRWNAHEIHALSIYIHGD